MRERLRRKFLEGSEKNSGKKHEKFNPRDLYESNLSLEISQIENLSVPKSALLEHLINNRSEHHYGARCLAILSVGKQTQIGKSTIIKMPETWQHLIGGKQVKLSEIGINAYKESMQKFEEAHPVEKP